MPPRKHFFENLFSTSRKQEGGKLHKAIPFNISGIKTSLRGATKSVKMFQIRNQAEFSKLKVLKFNISSNTTHNIKHIDNIILHIMSKHYTTWKFSEPVSFQNGFVYLKLVIM